MPVQLREKLTLALLENTRRKLQIKSQAIKLSRVLNGIDISPVFLKGTALLLEDDDELSVSDYDDEDDDFCFFGKDT